MTAAKESFDVIVIGSGLAGLAAAYEAQLCGCKTVILEKLPRYGGNSVLAGGGIASWDSRLHLRTAVGEDSPELMVQDALRSGRGENDPALVKILAEQAPAAVDWMMDAGVQFRNILFHMGGQTVPRSYQCESNGKNMLDAIKTHVLSTGVELRLGHCVTELLTENGRVCAVRCMAGDTTLTLEAHRGIVIAAGGYAADVALRKEYTDIGEAYNCSNHADATGEMIRCARALGAQLINMEYIQLFPCSNPVSGAVDRWALAAYAAAGAGAVYINSSGRRFVCELEGRDVVSNAQISGCEKPSWAILNDAMLETVDLSAADKARGLRSGRMVQANSLPELAEKLCIPAKTLENTIADHNTFIQGERTDPFGKAHSDLLTPLTAAPFYAIAQWPSVHFTMGGIHTDSCARVLRDDGSVIPGLFAAGEVCGGVHGANRLAGYALTECVVFGRLAGQNAAQED